MVGLVDRFGKVTDGKEEENLSMSSRQASWAFRFLAVLFLSFATGLVYGEPAHNSCLSRDCFPLLFLCFQLAPQTLVSMVLSHWASTVRLISKLKNVF